jgi:NAD(P)-dependent dehydrogenase (short-subunit alcohol dehydrogenase family)
MAWEPPASVSDGTTKEMSMTHAPDAPTAIVTGAARGIGAAIATRLAQDGLAVAVIDLDDADCAQTMKAIAAAGARGVAIAADVADEPAITGAVDRVAADLGSPTVLVNNAGFAHAAPVTDMTTMRWDEVLGVNLRAAFFATRAASRHMIDAGWGRIVNISSISAHGDAGRIGYASAKAGLIGFTKTLALELGPHAITANAIAPGFIVTDMTRRSAQRLGRDLGEYVRDAAEEIPVRRAGQPADIAHAASFLISRDAGFVSGQVLYVAGGPVG